MRVFKAFLYIVIFLLLMMWDYKQNQHRIDELHKINNSLRQLNKEIQGLSKKVDRLRNNNNKILKKRNPEILKISNVLQNQFQLDKEYSDYLSKIIYSAHKEFNVPISIIIAVIWQESHFKQDAISRAGCIGLMQVNPNVWKFDLPIEYLFIPEFNIRAGTYILRYYYDLTKDWNKAIYRYYGISKFGHKYRQMVVRKINLIKQKLS